MEGWGWESRKWANPSDDGSFSQLFPEETEEDSDRPHTFDDIIAALKVRHKI